MVKRRELKNKHEDAVLRQFACYLHGLGSSLKILERPEPPEAIVEINHKNTWIEIIDAFLDRDHAIGLTTGACEDVEHLSDSPRLVMDPDATFSSTLQSVIEAKYDKKSILSITEKRGRGILLVGIFTPFASAKDIAIEEAGNVANVIAQKAIRVFDSIFVYDGAGQRSFHSIYSEKT